MAITDEEMKAADDELNSVEVEPEEQKVETDEDGDEEESPAQQQARPGNAAERKRNRARNYREERERSEKLERELAETRMMMANLQGQVQQGFQQQRQQQQGPHPLEREVDSILEEQSRWYENYSTKAASGKLSAEENARYQREAADIEKRKGVAMSRLAMAQAGLGHAVNPQQAQQIAFQQQLNQRYPDLAANPQAYEYGGHLARAKAVKNGGQLNWDLLDEAAEETRKHFGMQSQRQRPAPSEEERAKVVSTGKGPTNAPGASPAGPIRITKQQAKMAEAAYPNDPPNKAHQKWWNNVGKKYAGKPA